jgi:cell fate (sporulation/competence/biofilm development) regulator YmcA (YheA/YmcA/DUF963 family)
LDKLHELIQELNKDESIIRYKELEAIIDQDEALRTEYKKLLDLQKILVQKKEKTKDFKAEEDAYNTQYSKVMSHYLMEEYLELVELVNNDLQLIQQIISDEINMNFDK